MLKALGGDAPEQGEEEAQSRFEVAIDSIKMLIEQKVSERYPAKSTQTAIY
jgi:hypothetical protein